MPTQIAVICDPDRFSAKLQALGRMILGKPAHPAYPYHVAWLTDNAMYDMNWNFRKIPRDHYDNRDVRVFDSPVDVPEEYLEMMIGKRKYGTMDVILYPILQLLGINWWGTHCAEAINDDIWFHGYRTPFIPYGAPPDPTETLIWLESLNVRRVADNP